MSHASLDDVFTITEVAYAAGVPVDAVRVLMSRGELKFIPGTRYISLKDAVRARGRLRNAAVTLGAAPAQELFVPSETTAPETGKPAVASLLAHVALVMLVVWLSGGRTETAALDDAVREDTHLVFLLSPGPGGGGGGGGLRERQPAPKIARAGTARPQLSVPPASEYPVATTAHDDTQKPTPVAPVIQPPPAPEPVAAPVIVAPVETIAANDRNRDGAIEHAVDGADSHGPGINGGVGSGHGNGNGGGFGPGVGNGEDGGIGGGPYRPGSGIEPPRLLREVKATYTEDARRQNITGDVLLEIVIRRDGSVGTVRVVQGLGAGLDERAIEAVRQWRFDAARRKGVPVDVLVQVAVEFLLR